MLYIDPVVCIDCGACVPVCPVEAIYAEDDLPYFWDHYAQINAAHYKKQRGETGTIHAHSNWWRDRK